MSVTMNIEHYVIMVSDHNVAEYRACLELRPKQVYLITTSKMHKPAERLRRKLDQLQLSSQIVTSQQLDAEQAERIQAWIQDEFLALAQSWQKGYRVLNMTGGTKLLSYLLTQCLAWDEIHYQAFEEDKARLQRLLNDHGKLILRQSQVLQQAINPIDALALYADHVQTLTPNPIRNCPDSLPLAQLRLEAQRSENTDNLFTVITPILKRYWYQQPTSAKHCHIPWHEFGLAREPIQTFMTRLDALNPQPLLRYDNNGITLPTPNAKGHAKHWVKWIGGEWFEQIIYQWLIDSGLKPQQISPNVQITRQDEHNPARGETDIVLFHKQKVYFLELKADIADNIKLSDYEKQLTSEASDLGKVQKMLIVAPAVRLNRKNEQQWQSFESRCRARFIEIVVAENAQAIQAKFN